MSLFVRWSVALVVVGLIVVLARLGVDEATRSGQPQRWFMPGPLGFEPGTTRGEANERGTGFGTRAFSGLRGPQAVEWGRRNGLTPALAFSHHLSTVFPPSLHATHPELFPLVDGARLHPPKGSYFWNPDIARPDAARHAAEAARKFFVANPAAPSFALGVNDALIWGESPELLALATPTKWFRERPDYSPVVFTFMNRAAAELSRTHPGKYLGTLAYYWAENVPPFPVQPQVIPFLTADRAQGYDDGFREEEFALQKKWGALAGASAAGDAGAEKTQPPRRLGIYDYVYGGGFLIPRMHPRLLAEHLRHAHGVGFTDYYAEVNPNWGLDGPMPWLTAQLVRDPAQDLDLLLNEYHARYFGAARAPMQRFLEGCERQWMSQPGPSYWLKHYRNESQVVVFPVAACRELRALLDEAARAADTPRVRARVQLVADAFGVTERFVAFHAAREGLFRLTVAPRTDAAALSAAVVEYLDRRGEFVGYTDALRASQPLALHPFDWSDYLKNDPLAAALRVLRAAGWGAGDGAGHDAAMERMIADPTVAPLWTKIQARSSAGDVAIVTRVDAPELLHDATMSGVLQTPRMIAGLTYGVALPAGWQSKVEPSQFHRAEFVGVGAARALRIEGTKDTMLSQWVALAGGGLHWGKVAVRGRVSPSTAVSLIVAFLDASHRHLGFKFVRLPDGEWAEWVTLQQAGEPPPAAAWVGLGLRVQNQMSGDWVEARDFSLRWEGR